MIVIIPAREGSKSIPNKNIHLIAGHPLIAYSIAAAKAVPAISKIVVSTDSVKIAEIAELYGAEVPFLRPKEFARDDSPDDEFLNHFFEHYDTEEAVLLRPTTPFRDIAFISNTIKQYHLVKKTISGLRSVHHISDSPYKLFKVTNNFLDTFFVDFHGNKNFSNLPRQHFPETYKADGHVDIVKRDTLLSGSVYGEKIYASIGEQIVDIDSFADLKWAAYHIATNDNELHARLEEILSKHTKV